jgi:hypothetical protein
MNRTDLGTYAPAADWLLGTAKRNPEALLVLAAGCALLLRGGRGGGSRASAPNRRWEQNDYRGGGDMRAGYADRAARAAGEVGQSASDLKDRVSETAGSYASAVSDTARSYATSVADYAGSAGRAVAAQTTDLADRAAGFADQAGSVIRTQTNNVLQEQPLAVAVLGLAAGAALAALFPTSAMEQRTLGPARDAAADTVARVGESLKTAANVTGEHLKQRAAERGLSTEGIKEMAREAGQTFADKVSGKPEEQNSRTASGHQAGVVTAPTPPDVRGKL